MQIVLKYILLFILITGASCTKFQKILKSDDIDAKTNAAFEYYEKDKDYYKSSLLLEELIPVLKGGKQAEKAQFYFAYTQFKQKDYNLSAYYFQKFNETYPLSEFAEEALYMYVYSLYKISPRYNLDQSNTVSAIEAIESFLRKYPKSRYIPECNDIFDALNKKLEKKEYENTKQYYKLQYNTAAVTAISNFMRKYPMSDYNEELAYLKIETQVDLAKVSIDEKKKDRYYEAVTFYENFVDRFPNSKYQKSAENLYESAVKQLEKLSETKN
jgi:outer membrane protein assembly factor BamD